MRGVLFDHLAEYRLHFGLKFRLNLIYICELGKSPAAVATVIVHTGHPVGVHSRLLLFGVFSAIALDLDDKMQQVIFATAIINQNDKVRDVRPRFRAVVAASVPRTQGSLVHRLVPEARNARLGIVPCARAT